MRSSSKTAKNGSVLVIQRCSDLIFDFDGVIADSNPLRTQAFADALEGYPEPAVAQLLDYHRKNGGISRYRKFDLFFTDFLQRTPLANEKEEILQRFTKGIRRALHDPQILIEDSVGYIRARQEDYRVHIASASDGKELREACHQLGIDNLFESINGTPPLDKADMLESILSRFSIASDGAIYVGDSVNDREAASRAGLRFFGYRNPELCEGADSDYLDSVFELDDHVAPLQQAG